MPHIIYGDGVVLVEGPLKNLVTYFANDTFTDLSLKKCIITFTNKGAVSWRMYPVNPITNSYRLIFQIIDTNYCYQLLLPIVTEVRRRQ